MKDVLKTMVEHPIATWFVIGVTANSLIGVITCLKKNVTINVCTKKTKTE